MREVSPRIAIGAVVFPHRAPLPLTEIGSPPSPTRLLHPLAFHPVQRHHADPLRQRTACNILPNQLRAVCGNDLIVLHDEQRAAGFCRVAIQYALDGQRRFLHKFRRGIAVGKQEQLCAFCPVCRNIHSRAIFQQDALHIGLSRVR